MPEKPGKETRLNHKRRFRLPYDLWQVDIEGPNTYVRQSMKWGSGVDRLTILEILCSITEQDDSPLLAVRCLVQNVYLQTSQLGNGLLKHLTQTLNR